MSISTFYLSRLAAGALTVVLAMALSSCETNSSCDPGLSICDAQCVSLLSDAAHCGGCAIACAGGMVCEQGQCVPECSCAAPPQATASCTEGVCGIGMCDAGFGDCNMSPSDGCEININSDPDHCTACNMPCPARENASRTCAEGSCGFTCNAGFSDCDSNPANGCEFVGGTCPQCSGGAANGSLQAGEECDDNNMQSGDGCSSGCTVEPFFQCNTALAPNTCTKQEQICNDGIDNDGDGNIDAADPACVLPGYFPACAAGQALHVYKVKGLPMAFVDSGSFTIQLNAPLTGTIQKAAVVINATHAFDADVDLSLSPPGGAFVDICSDNGGAGKNFANMVLDSTCGTAVTSGTAPFAGCFRPETSLASLNQTQARGVWSLRVTDDGMGDTGTLSDWALALCTTP